MIDLVPWYWTSFIITSLFCTILQLYSRNTSKNAYNSNLVKFEMDTQLLNNEKFGEFQTNYLIAYLLAMFADWLQGPYVYELYEVCFFIMVFY